MSIGASGVSLSAGFACCEPRGTAAALTPASGAERRPSPYPGDIGDSHGADRQGMGVGQIGGAHQHRSSRTKVSEPLRLQHEPPPVSGRFCPSLALT